MVRCQLAQATRDYGLVLYRIQSIRGFKRRQSKLFLLHSLTQILTLATKPRSEIIPVIL